MSTKSLLSRKVQLAFACAILTLVVVGAISYRSMQDEELQLLALHNAEANRRLGQTKDALILGTLVALGIVGAAGWSIQRDSLRRALAEEALRASEIKFRRILESAPDAMVIADAQGRILLVNGETERLFGYRRDELIGHPVEILMPERFRGRHPQQRQEYTAHPRTRPMDEGLELYGLRKDNTEFPAEISLIPIETPEGKVTSSAIRDVTARKAAEKALREAEERQHTQTETDLILTQQMQLKDEFLSHVSHELRSPLTAIHLFVTNLLDKLAGDLNPEQHECLGIVLRNVKQLQAMINDLLEVTRVQAGKLMIELQCTPASDAIVYAVNTLQGAATAKGITLSSDISRPLPSVCADPTRIRQILVILVDNAIKFTPAKGTVKIRARLFEGNPNLLVLEVADSGCGISADMTERIFERLFQTSDPALAGRKGLGLGLYICKELVARQGGQIWAKSAAGQGAVFSFTVPVFSLPNLIAPALLKERRTEGLITLVVTEIASQTGWLSDEVRAEQSLGVRDLLQRCIHSDLDVLLPKMNVAGAAELFFIVAITDGIGGEAITRRIRDQLDSCQNIRQAGLTFSSSYRALDPIKRSASESMGDFLERVAAKVQQSMNEEISSRMVAYEQ